MKVQCIQNIKTKEEFIRDRRNGEPLFNDYLISFKKKRVGSFLIRYFYDIEGDGSDGFIKVKDGYSWDDFTRLYKDLVVLLECEDYTDYYTMNKLKDFKIAKTKKYGECTFLDVDRLDTVYNTLTRLKEEQCG